MFLYEVLLFGQIGAISLVAGVGLLVLLLISWCCFRYIPNNSVGVVEKLWSSSGSVAEGQIIALQDEAGFQADLLRGGIHFGYWRWQYAVHQVPLVTISQGKIGYVYARDGQPLTPNQALGRDVPCNSYQDAIAFLTGNTASAGNSTTGSSTTLPSVDNSAQARGEAIGQRGRQRAILREGVYAINPALFVVLTEERVFGLGAIQTRQEIATIEEFRKDLQALGGFVPVVVGSAMNVEQTHSPDQPTSVDTLGIVTIHDGPSLPAEEIIAPAVGGDTLSTGFHNHFQDPGAFLKAGGRRGRQYQVLTDGTYFLNRWFASVELIPKTVVPIGYVGVVVSYVGKHGSDVSGKEFRHGEQVACGEKGVWERALGPENMRLTVMQATLSLCPPRTLCCTGSPDDPNRTSMTKVCDR